MATLVASYLARSRGSNEPELSITRVKDLEQFIRECQAFQMDNGHVIGDEFDDKLAEKRRRFEELLGNANGCAPFLTLYKVSPNLCVQRTEIIPTSVKAIFHSLRLTLLVYILDHFWKFSLTVFSPTVSTHALRYIYPNALNLSPLSNLQLAQ